MEVKYHNNIMAGNTAITMAEYSKSMFFALSFTCELISLIILVNYPNSNFNIFICTSQTAIIIYSAICYDNSFWGKCSAFYSLMFFIACVFKLGQQNMLVLCTSTYMLGRILNYYHIKGRISSKYQILVTTIVISHLLNNGCPIALFPILYALFHCHFLSGVIYSSLSELSDKVDEMIIQDKSKDTCFAALIHELRNPLTAYIIN